MALRMAARASTVTPLSPRDRKSTRLNSSHGYIWYAVFCLKEKTQGPSNRGFAAMSPERQKEIASEGGRAAHQQGVAHERDSEEARQAGRKGGQSVSQNREH